MIVPDSMNLIDNNQDRARLLTEPVHINKY